MEPQQLVSKSFPGCAMLETGAWFKKDISSKQGDMVFNICHISSDICCTLSDCTFQEDYQITIAYPQPVILLIFGLEGYSHFGFEPDEHICTVRKGDVWLVNILGNVIYRSTPAHVRSRMLVIKYSSDRINRAFKTTDDIDMLMADAQMLRLTRQQAHESQLSRLLNNPMTNASNRLLAEASALELMAHWMIPSKPCSPTSIAGIKCSFDNNRDLDLVIKRLIRDLANPPKLELLAKDIGMSHTRLNRHFRKAYGMTVFSWLRNYRLERAKNYLKANERSITTIAFECGFSGASHFSQCFKKYYGCSPVEYRQTN